MSLLHPKSTRLSPRQTDGIMLFAVFVGAMMLLGVGYSSHSLRLAGELAGACALLALVPFVLLRGSVWSRLALSSAALGIICAHMYVSGARAEAYLGMFLLGSLLPQYRNWKLVLLTLTALGAFLLTWVDRQPGRLDTAWVLCGLSLQYTYLAYVAWSEERAEAERFELEFLIRAMGFDGPIRLNLDVLRADSVVGKRLKHVQHRMAEAIRQVHQSIAGVQQASGVLRQGSSDLSSRTMTTASGLRDAAMCLEQINVIVQTSAQASMEARTMAARATDLADSGGQQVRLVVDTMQAISQSSRRITDIISVIDGIAFQTNILALNAAVEAARAGEQGRGFAVVAAEVRSLALRSSEAAKEIKSLISESLRTVEAGVEQVNLTGSTMNDIVESVRRVGEVFERLSADSHEHAGGIDVVTQSVKELDDVTQRNIAVAEASSHIATELLDHASKMSEVLSAFKLGGSALGSGLIGAPASAPTPVASVPGNIPPTSPIPIPIPIPSMSAAPAKKAESENIEFF